MALCRYCNLCAEIHVCPLTLVSWSNATVFGFVLDASFTADPTANKVVAIGFVTAGIGFVLGFWYQFRYNRATATRSQVRSHPGASPSLPWVPALSHRISDSIAPVLCCPQSVAAGDPGYPFIGRYVGYIAIPLVWCALDRARYSHNIQEG